MALAINYFSILADLIEVDPKRASAYLMNLSKVYRYTLSHLDPQRFMRVNRQFIISAAAVQKLSTYFLGKMRIHMTAAPDEEIIVSKDKVATVKRWLDS